jgi:hypothetical protein
VDGFDQDKGASKGDECTVAVLGFVTTHGNPLEALQLADGLLDPGTGLVEQSWKELGLVPGILAIRNNRNDAAATASCAIGRCIVPFVGDRGTRRDIRSDVERDLKLRGIADLAAGQMEGNG